jgi:Mg-chelatase subunit ChlI
VVDPSHPTAPQKVVHLVDEDTLRLLLEGRPGVGKTTVARRLLKLLREAGVPVGGFSRRPDK